MDNGSNGIWVWVGKQATQKERSQALKYALELIRTKNYSVHTEVTKVIEDGETAEFKTLFKTWGTANEKEKKSFAQLYHLRRNGTFEAVPNFDKDDLEPEQISLLGKKHLQTI